MRKRICYLLLPAFVALSLFAVTEWPVSASGSAKIELGKKVFTELADPSCGVCHMLKDAGTTGRIGPPLDELQPSIEDVELAVRGGLGVMPAFEALSDEQVKAVAIYVAKVTGGEEVAE